MGTKSSDDYASMIRMFAEFNSLTNQKSKVIFLFKYIYFLSVSSKSKKLICFPYFPILILF